MICLASTLPYMYNLVPVVFGTATPTSLKMFLHIDMSINTYRNTVPEFESLCLCSEGMDVPACMQV